MKLGGYFLSNSLLTSFQTKTASPPDTIKPTLNSNLLKINQQFGRVHHRAAKGALDAVETIIIYRGNELSLWQKQEGDWKKEVTLTLAENERYLQAKSINHLCILTTELISQAINTLSDSHHQKEIRIELNMLYSQLLSLKYQITEAHKDDYLPYHQMIIHTLSLLQEAINEEMVDWPIRKKTYICCVKKLMDHANHVATESQLTQLHDTILHWENQYNIKADTTRVITVSAPGPGEKHIETSYLARWLKERMPSSTIIHNNLLYHIESLPSKISQLDCKDNIINEFLTKAELNKKIGLDYLDNQQAMFQDVLASYAESVIQKLLPNDNFKKTPK